MKRIIVGILAIALALLPLAGCGSEVIEGAKALETEEPAGLEQVEPEVEELSPEDVNTAGTDETQAESVEEPEATIDKEEEKEEERIVYEPPEPQLEVMPLFTSAELDLTSSTPEEIIIRILYYDEVGEGLDWEGILLGGKVEVEIWKGIPTEEERHESRQGNEAYYESFVLLGRIGQTGFCVRSSQNVIVIPTSTLNPYDGDEVALRVYIDPLEWGVDFAGQNPNLPNALNYLEAPLQKNW